MENLHSDKTTAQSSLVPTLETVQGDSAGDSFALKFKTRGGREQDNDIVVADPRASRYHFQIAYEDGQWLLTDLGSVNGTYLNSLAVSDVPQVLQNNDQIMIGETIFAFKNPIAEKAFDTTSQAVSTKKREERRAKTPSWIWVIVASVLFVFVVILVGIGFLLMGNGSNTITSPTMTAQLVPDVGGTSSIPTAFILKYEDDFSTSDSGWDDAFGAYYTKQYGNNQYHIEINTHDLVVWGLANRNAHDFEVEVEATKEEGDIGNTYGIIFRYFDHDNYYRFDVSSDGFYLITKLQNGEWIKLLDWTESPNIKQGHDTNKLKVSAIGSTMTLFANGQKLTQVTDNNNPILSGNFGFFASTFSDSHIWVSFDNFKLWATEGQEIVLIATPTPTQISTVTPHAKSTLTNTPVMANTPELIESPIAEVIETASQTPEISPDLEKTTESTPIPPTVISTIPLQETDATEQLPDFVSHDQPPARSESALSGKLIFPVYDAEQGTYNIFQADINGDNRTLLAQEASQPAVRGNQLAYRSWRADNRGLISMKIGANEQWRFVTFFEAASPIFSPDGQFFIFHSRQGGETPALYRTFGENHEVMRHDSFPIQGNSPALTPDENIIYRSCTGGSCGLFLTSLDGGFLQQLTTHANDTAPVASPDGEKIAFTSNRSGNWDVYALDKNGQDVRQLTQYAGNDGLPTWSPDGQTIAYVSDHDGTWAVWAMTSTGDNQQLLFDLQGSIDGKVQIDLNNSLGWLEERIVWIP